MSVDYVNRFRLAYDERSGGVPGFRVQIPMGTGQRPGILGFVQWIDGAGWMATAAPTLRDGHAKDENGSIGDYLFLGTYKGFEDAVRTLVFAWEYAWR